VQRGQNNDEGEVMDKEKKTLDKGGKMEKDGSMRKWGQC